MRTVIGPNEIRVRSNDHKRNFLDAIRTGRQPISHIEAAVRGETMCQIGDIATRLKRKLRWDPEKETSRMTRRQMRDCRGRCARRGGWKLRALRDPRRGLTMIHMSCRQKLLSYRAAHRLRASTLAAAQPNVADMDALLAKIAKFEHGQSREPLGQFMEMVLDSMGSQAQLRQIEARLLKFLESGPDTGGKGFRFRPAHLHRDGCICSAIARPAGARRDGGAGAVPARTDPRRGSE